MTDPEPEGNDRPNWETRAETGLPTDLELMISRLEDMMITDDGRIGGYDHMMHRGVADVTDE